MWDLSDFESMARYIRNYRLFGHLTTFRVGCLALKVGQMMEPMCQEKERRKAYVLSSSLQALGLEDPEPSKRYPNELLPLRGLVFLEEFVMEVTRVPGTVVPRDFEFLQRMESDFGARFHPPPHSAPRRATRIPTMKENDKEEDEGEDENDSEDENDYGEVEAYKDVRTFWPRLTTFHINYLQTYSLDHMRALAQGIEQAQIRPGVAFRFRRSFNSPRDARRYL